MGRHQVRPAGDRQGDSDTAPDEGFTLVELLVVVLIISLLLAIGLPTFLGAQQRSSNRRAQAHVRQTYVTQLTHATEAQRFTEDPTVLASVDASLSYTPDLAPLTAGTAPPEVVFVDAATAVAPDDTVVVAARSKTGNCYWMKATLNTPVSFATNDCSATPVAGDFSSAW